jgi:exosortase/archaeosortase family protein
MRKKIESVVVRLIPERERELVYFLLKLLLIWLSWKGIFWVLGEEKTPVEDRLIPALSNVWEQFNLWVVKVLLTASEFSLKAMGYSSHITERSIWIEDVHAVGVGNYCLGFQLIYYNTMLIIISKVSAKRKLFLSVLGIGITQLLNVFRITGLSILALKKPELVPFFHDHVFNLLVFGIMIFIYWKFIANLPSST